MASTTQVPSSASATAQPQSPVSAPLPGTSSRRLKRPPPIHTGFGMQASKSKKPATADASVKAKNKDRTILVERTLKIKHQDYKLALRVPVNKPDPHASTEDQQSERTRCRKEAEDLADVMVADLIKQIDELMAKSKAEGKSGFQPGDDLQIVFIENGTYVIAPSDADSSIDLDAVKASDPEKKIFVAKGDASEVISKAIRAGTAGKMHGFLQSPLLNTLRETMRSDTAEKAKGAAPVKLKWDKNSCFLDAPLSLLLHDPTVADDLGNPDHFIEGESNVLYRAVQEYRKAQAQGRKEVNLAKILREDEKFDGSGSQMDARTDAWNKFGDCFNFAKLPAESHLHGLFKRTPDFALPEDDAGEATLEELASTAFGRDSAARSDETPELGAVVCLHARNRLTKAPLVGKLSDKLTDDEINQFIKAFTLTEQDYEALHKLNVGETGIQFGEEHELNSEEYAQLCGLNEANLEGKNLLRKYYLWKILTQTPVSGSGAEKYKNTAALLLDNPDRLTDAVSTLPKSDLKDKINGLRDTKRVKSTCKVKIPPGDDKSRKVQIGDKTYNLFGFTLHTGQDGRGHYVTYYKAKDGQYHKLDDRNGNTTVSEAAFYSAAEEASTYVLHEEGLVVQEAASSKASGAKEKEKPKGLIKYEDPLEGDRDGMGNVVEVGTGKLSDLEKDCVIAHPTVAEFRETDSQVKELDEDNQLQKQLKTQVAATESIWRLGKVKSFTPRGYGMGPDCLTAEVRGFKIVNVPVDKSKLETAVKDLIDACQAEGASTIAIPLIGNKEPMKEAVKKYFREKPNCRGLKVRIIQSPAAVVASA